MATYSFDTISAAQAQAFGSEDSLLLPTGSSAKTTTILYLEDGTYAMGIGGRTVAFNSYFLSHVQRFRFPDDSILFVGGATADVRDYGAVPSSGAMYGGDGSDTLTSSPGDWLIQGNQGDDQISVRTLGSNTIYGGQGNDRVIMVSGGGAEHSQFVQGNKGNDTLQGTNEGDTLLGGQGDDVIYGSGFSADFINGNLGNDTLNGVGQLLGEGGDDSIVVAGGAAFTVSGGDGNDAIQIGSGNVAVRGLVHGDAGNDTIGISTDVVGEVYGDAGDDRIQVGQNGVFGAINQSRLLDGGSGNDTLIGSGGAETISGGGGSDQLSGGAGADVFVASTAQALTRAAADAISDWSADDFLKLRASIGSAYAETSAVDFDSALKAAQDQIAAGQIEAVAVQVGADVIVFADASPGTTIDSITVLTGRSLSDIAAGDFL